MKTIQNFPHFFENEDYLFIGKPVTEIEVKNTLMLFAKDKSPVPDDWTMEFYWNLFNFFGQEITEAMEETWIQRKINEVLNATYLTLIPKKDHLDSFNDFRPISLCNFLYKIVSKIIPERLKPFLGKDISQEQFAFLPDRKITDAVGTIPKCLHSVKVQKKNSFFLKLDLLKE